MDDINRLNLAFRSFTEASKTLETYYDQLREKVKHLTLEVEEKNRQLADALDRTEEAKDYLRCVLQSMAEAIIVLDTDRNVTMINSAAERLIGVVSAEAAGRNADALGFSVEHEGTETVLRTGQGGCPVIMSLSEVRDADGRPRGHVILFRDVSRLKELESQQERNQRLISMGEMAAKIVHEIRSPLCSIELYASMLAKDLEGTEHARLAKGISSGIGSLNAILTNMLYFAKPQKPLVRTVDLRRTVNESLFLLMPLLESRGIGLTNHAAGECEIPGDPELIKQVFLNILMNAVQVTPAGGRITVSSADEEGSAVITIADEGEGIEAANLEKIFDPFFSTKEKGTGLGLTIASKIMIAHGGSIRVSSSPAEGSSFSLCFPKAHDHAEASAIFGKGVFL